MFGRSSFNCSAPWIASTGTRPVLPVASPAPPAASSTAIGNSPRSPRDLNFCPSASTHHSVSPAPPPPPQAGRGPPPPGGAGRGGGAGVARVAFRGGGRIHPEDVLPRDAGL